MIFLKYIAKIQIRIFKLPKMVAKYPKVAYFLAAFSYKSSIVFTDSHHPWVRVCGRSGNHRSVFWLWIKTAS